MRQDPPKPGTGRRDAGTDVSVAKVEPQARAVLSRFETTATHYQIDVP